eukprot:CAMPEP_0173082162 /NCGR_PEP_ID=MMETSP1102-20130122/17999_1 /TAXON_ID=49646 /ORGANISM="Geminigera sp., Strain Caron Lab Isolate" /LENGTH=330 /DNA_ID=CAMNT_0013957471 /DNA_START=113 /DNA_END=1102 /DNA_ORIENTATION=-
MGLTGSATLTTGSLGATSTSDLLGLLGDWGACVFIWKKELIMVIVILLGMQIARNIHRWANFGGGFQPTVFNGLMSIHPIEVPDKKGTLNGMTTLLGCVTVGVLGGQIRHDTKRKSPSQYPKPSLLRRNHYRVVDHRLAIVFIINLMSNQIFIANAYTSCSSKQDCVFQHCSDRPCDSDSYFCIDGIWEYGCHQDYWPTTSGPWRCRSYGPNDWLYDCQDPPTEGALIPVITSTPSPTVMKNAVTATVTTTTVPMTTLTTTTPSTLCGGDAHVFSVSDDTSVCVPNNIYPSINVSHCVFENTWRDVVRDNRQFFKTGGLGQLMSNGWEVW